MARARVALAAYQFSNPDIVVAHFDPETALLHRRILLEIKVLGLRYLCPAVVHRVRDEGNVYGFRYDTLEGHIERGVEWFLLTKNEVGEIRFRIEARWQRGRLPNWWSRVGFVLLVRDTTSAGGIGTRIAACPCSRTTASSLPGRQQMRPA